MTQSQRRAGIDVASRLWPLRSVITAFLPSENWRVVFNAGRAATLRARRR